jgi:hypothetical protein
LFLLVFWWLKSSLKIGKKAKIRRWTKPLFHPYCHQCEILYAETSLIYKKTMAQKRIAL